MKKTSLLSALVLLAVGGLLLHARVHPFMQPDKLSPGNLIFDLTRFFSFIFSLTDVVVVTLLFLSRKTAIYGYMLNGLIAIYGTVIMTHFSIVDMSVHSIPLSQILIRTTLPDIGICWADFFVGKALYDYYRSGGQ
jgi:hypothetical protein